MQCIATMHKMAKVFSQKTNCDTLQHDKTVEKLTIYEEIFNKPEH